MCEGCGVPLQGAGDGHRLECDACMQTPRPWQQARAALIYKAGARKLVLALKHGDRQDIVRPAARWLAQAAGDLALPDMLVAPVPLHRTRLLKRRYNQSALLSAATARILQMDHCPDLLIRTKRTESLGDKSADERFALLANAIEPNPKRADRMVGRPVLLIDDVMTSGATLDGATRACLAAGSGPVNVLVLARVANGP